MMVKIIFLIMLCIPVGCGLLFLMIDTVKDIPKAKQKQKLENNLIRSRHRKTRDFKIAK
ncbi:hypothetical protein IZY60_08925 [Lutibacter sp. B2]|nr:hypothetical protein [Lutibacter sp. B2]